MRRLWLSILACIFAVTVICAPFTGKHYNMTYLDMRNGLPGNYVMDIHLDSYGFIWVATSGSGLVKYDGYNYYSPTSIDMGFTPRSNSCRNIAEDKFHRLWVTYEEGTDIIDLHSMHKWEPRGDSLIHKALSQGALTVYRDSKDCIWLVARTYIYYIELDEKGDVRKVIPYRYSSNRLNICISDMEHDGSVWASIEGGLYRLRVKNDKIVREPIAQSITDIHFADIGDFMWKDNELWISTDRGLFRFDKSYRLLGNYQKGDGKGLLHNLVTRLATGPGGVLIAGTLGGINIYDPTKDSFVQWTTKSEKMPLSSDFISCIKYLQGLLWIGTETGGVMKLSPRELKLTNYIHSDDPASLSPNAVNAMYAEEDGTLWVGTVEGGLNRKEPGKETFEHFTKTNSALPHNAVSTLKADNRRQLWIGTWGGGLCTASLDKPQQIVPLAIDERHAQQFTFIGALQYDAINDLMWVGTNDGLYYYDYETGQIQDPFLGCTSIRGCIGSIIDREGWLWMGHLEGGIRIDLRSRSRGANGNDFKFELLKYKLDNPDSKIIEKMCCFYETRDGSLWIGSNEYGLYRRIKDKNANTRYQNFNIQHGLANNGVKGIVEDKNGILWITTRNGLSQFNPQTGVFNNYTEDDGLPNSQFYWNSAIISSQGTIYLGTNSGLSALYGIDNENTYKGHLRFTQLNIDNHDITADGHYLNEDISQARKLTLHESDKALNISFSALNYGNERNGIYSYRMKGFEDEWIKLPMGQHSIRYTSLPGGTYTLEVKYASALSSSEEIIQLDIEVVPYFWKRWWFISGVIILLTVAGAWLYRKRMEQVRRKAREQEAEKAMAPIVKALNESKDPKQLQQRIESILHIQKQYEDSYSKSAEENKEDTKKKNKPFMEKVIRILEQNYSYSEFGVPELCEAMNMSRPLLSKRLNEEAGLPTTQFIRNYRLNIARQLLQESGGRNITEIAYSVGFNDPKYFTRCFTKLYGTSPSAIQ